MKSASPQAAQEIWCPAGLSSLHERSSFPSSYPHDYQVPLASHKPNWDFGGGMVQSRLGAVPMERFGFPFCAGHGCVQIRGFSVMCVCVELAPEGGDELAIWKGNKVVLLLLFLISVIMMMMPERGSCLSPTPPTQSKTTQLTTKGRRRKAPSRLSGLVLSALVSVAPEWTQKTALRGPVPRHTLGGTSLLICGQPSAFLLLFHLFLSPLSPPLRLGIGAGNGLDLFSQNRSRATGVKQILLRAQSQTHFIFRRAKGATMII